MQGFKVFHDGELIGHISEISQFPTGRTLYQPRWPDDTPATLARENRHDAEAALVSCYVDGYDALLEDGDELGEYDDE